MKRTITILVIIGIALIIFLLLGPFYVLEEGQQAVVTRFGRIVTTNTEAGLKFKTPIVDNVVKYSEKILSWDGDAQRIPTQENQFIWVDTTARWEITDPQLFYESVKTMQQGFARLDEVIDSSIRTIIARNRLREAVRNSNIINEIEREEEIPDEVESDESYDLSELTATDVTYETIEKGRVSLSNEMLERARSVTPQYGIELIDIIIRQIRYSDDLTSSVYERMIKERNQIAEAYRSFGEGKKAEWMGKLENDKKTILSEAYNTSEEIKGEADATASQLYAQSYEADEEFFEFWRSIESYRKVIPTFKKTLSTEMEYFDYLYNAESE